MNPINDLRGIITVLNTPFTPDLELDIPSLERHAAYAAQAGVCGFLLPAMASEVFSLSSEERRQILACVRKTAPQHLLIGGASAPTQEESVAYARECLELGCDGVLVSIGPEHACELVPRLSELAALKPGFIMLQDWDAEGEGLPDDAILDAFSAVDAFTCIKVETVGANEKYTRLLKASDGKLHVSGGWAVTQMIDGLRRGVHAFMPTGMHATYTSIYNMFHAGEEAKAEELFAQLAPILEYSNQDLDTSILFFKRLLHLQGIYETDLVRGDLELCDEDALEEADDILEMAFDLENESRRMLGLPNFGE